MTEIRAGVRSPDEATFWGKWIARGICTAPYEFVGIYAQCVQITTQSRDGWTPTKNGVPVNGWHANFRVTGPLAAQFRAGLPQTDENGAPLGIWQSTNAATVFGLTYQDADPDSGFPAGYRDEVGNVYADASDFKSPTNVWT